MIKRKDSSDQRHCSHYLISRRIEGSVKPLNNRVKCPSTYRKAIVIVGKVIVGRVPLNKLLNLWKKYIARN